MHRWSVDELSDRYRSMLGWDTIEHSHKLSKKDKIWYWEKFLEECRAAGTYISDDNDRQDLQRLASGARDYLRDRLKARHQYYESLIERYDPKSQEVRGD
jgi:hypothetical protein